MDAGQVESVHPLTPPQLGMLLASAAAPGSGMYVEQLSFELAGGIDVANVAAACQQLVERHPMLRTAFVWKEQEDPLQVVLRQARMEVGVEDWGPLSPAEHGLRLGACLESDRQRGFDLNRPPLVRLKVLRLGSDSVRLVWTHHHILMDGWCQAVLLEEWFELYRAGLAGDQPQLTTPRPYADYIDWLARQDVERTRAYWRQALAGFTPAPLARLREGMPVAGTGYEQSGAGLDASTTEALRALARRHRVTLSSAVQGAWALVLARYGGRDEVVFGVTVSGRPADLPGIERTVGLFINTLPLRARVDPGARFWDWLRELQDAGIELREFEHTPAAAVNGWCGIPDGVPLFESVLVYENYPTPDAGGSGLLGGLIADGGRTRHPLVVLAADDTELRLEVVQDARVERGASSRIAGHLRSVLRAAAADPEIEIARLMAAVPEAEAPFVAPARPSLASPSEAPATATEQALAGLWASVLGHDAVGRDDSFFDLGGHSQSVVRMVTEARAAFGVELPLGAVFEAPSLAGLATAIDRALSAPGGVLDAHPSPLLELQAGGDAPPLFCVHPINGQVLCYLPLAGELWPDQPLYCLQGADVVDALTEPGLAELAARYVAALRSRQERGPYRLAGWSMGGLIAFEMARRLAQGGHEVALLAVIDTPLPATRDDPHDEDDDFAAVLRLFPMELTADLRRSHAHPEALTPEARLAWVRDTLCAAGLVPAATDPSWIRSVQSAYRARRRAVRRWQPQPYPGRITYFRGRDQEDGLEGSDDGYGWRAYCSGIDVHEVPGDHDSLIAPPHVSALARELRACLLECSKVPAQRPRL